MFWSSRIRVKEGRSKASPKSYFRPFRLLSSPSAPYWILFCFEIILLYSFYYLVRCDERDRGTSLDSSSRTRHFFLLSTPSFPFRSPLLSFSFFFHFINSSYSYFPSDRRIVPRFRFLDDSPFRSPHVSPSLVLMIVLLDLPGNVFTS